MKQVIVTIFKVGFAFGLIAWMIQRGLFDLSTLAEWLSPLSVAVCLGLAILGIFINNLRWQFLLVGQGFSVDFRQTLPLTLIGIFFNFAMPGGVGGDVMKVYYIIRDFPEARMKAAATVVMDRVVGLFVMVGMAFVAMILQWQWFMANPKLARLFTVICVVFIAFALAFVVLFSRRVHDLPWVQRAFAVLPGGAFAERLYRVFHSYRSPQVLFKAVVASFASQIATIFLFIAVGYFMGMGDVPWLAHFFVVPLGLITMSLPLAPAGIGVGQMALYYLFNWYLGYNSQLGPNSITALQVGQFAWGLLGAYFYLRRGRAVPQNGEVLL